MSRSQRRRPSPGRVSAALAVVGLVAALAILVVPVRAAFGDDPLLALQPFSASLESPVTAVDCGRPLRNFGRHAEGLSLYALASADACRRAASRRAAIAVASGSVIGLFGLIGLAGSRNRPVVVA